MKKSLTLVFAALAISACSKDRNNDPVRNITEATNDRDLQGKVFVSQCSLKPIDAIATGVMSGGKASIKGAQTAYLIQGANLTHTTRLYSTADCSGDAALTFEELGDVRIDKNQKTNDGGYYIDFDYHSVKTRIATDVGATAANAVQLCGVKTWAKGQDQDVTINASNANCYGAAVPRHEANLYRVDANNLYFGKADANGNRPSALDMKTMFIAQ